MPVGLCTSYFAVLGQISDFRTPRYMCALFYSAKVSNISPCLRTINIEEICNHHGGMCLRLEPTTMHCSSSVIYQAHRLKSSDCVYTQAHAPEFLQTTLAGRVSSTAQNLPCEDHCRGAFVGMRFHSCSCVSHRQGLPGEEANR